MEKLSKSEKKIRRKVKKSCKILEKFEGIKTVEGPTKILLIGNGGLVNSIPCEALMKIFCTYGPVEELLMVPDRPYAFIIYHDAVSAVDAVQHLNGKADLNVDGTAVCLYLSYVNKVPDLKNSYAGHTLPPGLILLPDFVSPDEEQKLLASIEFEDENVASRSLKHRAVQHYGYEFKYGVNDVDKDKPLMRVIPEHCSSVLQRIVEQGRLTVLPDQLTVNKYLPKQGIPPHIDTHSAFEDGIASLSLGSQVIMEFKHPSGIHVPVYLPRRSLLIMKGESRYLWTHGISQRKVDIVPVMDDNGKQVLTAMERSTRTSFTFRKVRHGDCTCGYSGVCNSQKTSFKTEKYRDQETFGLTDEQAIKLEEKHVFQVYDQIADHFSYTRHKPWPQIAEFLSALPSGSVLLDVGCGNGKYLGRGSSLIEVGCDISSSLVGICRSRNLEVFQANGLHLPLRSGIADACLSIAVLHHLSTQARREQAISELVRLLKPSGLALVYVWALEQEGPTGPSNYLKTSRTNTNCSQDDSGSAAPQEAQLELGNVDTVGVNLPIHRNRTNFAQQDLLVPWQYKNGETSKSIVETENATVYHRFYHVFRQHELESLAKTVPNVYLQKSYYDKGNWCVILKKI